MGNRILKESILLSPQIMELDWFEEVFFYRLIVSADDYGIYPAECGGGAFPTRRGEKRKPESNGLSTAGCPGHRITQGLPLRPRREHSP